MVLFFVFYFFKGKMGGDLITDACLYVPHIYKIGKIDNNYCTAYIGIRRKKEKKKKFTHSEEQPATARI